MEPHNPSPILIRFGIFEADLAAAELRRRGRRVKLEAQPFHVLCLLIRRPGELVTREELRKELWSDDTFVEFDHSLNTAVKKIRQALGDSPRNPQFVETMPRQGYRFIGTVEQSGEETPVASDSRLPGKRLVGWIAASLLFAAATAALTWFVTKEDRAPEHQLIPFPITALPGYESQASLSPDGSQVAFTWNGGKGDNFDIYVQVVGAEKPRRLTTYHDWDTTPKWSPDGRWITFLRTLDQEAVGVFLIDPLGTHERLLTSVRCEAPPSYWANLAWTPDSQSLIVADRTSTEEPCALFLLKIEALEKSRLTTPPAGSGGDSTPALSPDRRCLAFRRAADLYMLSLSDNLVPRGSPRRIVGGGQRLHGIAWMPDGSEVIYGFAAGAPGLRSDSLDLWRVQATGVVKPEPIGLSGEFPTISQDGSRLVFNTTTTHPVDIWCFDVETKQSTAGPPRKRVVSSTRVDHLPAFSPDGQQIAFVSERTGNPEVWICDANGQDPFQRTSSDGASAEEPAWSPDGTRIAFSLKRDNQGDIFVIGSRSGAPNRLTDDPANDYWPSWSRDGEWLYFTSDRTGRDEVWRMATGGGDAVQVTRNGGTTPSVSPDGKYVYYLRDSALWRIPVQSGEETQLLEAVRAVNYAVTDRGIYFIPSRGFPEPGTLAGYSIRYLDFVSGDIREITKLDHLAMWGLSVSPNGESIVVPLWEGREGDLMLVENFR